MLVMAINYLNKATVKTLFLLYKKNNHILCKCWRTETLLAQRGKLTINTPYDHQSAEESWPLRLTTSGAMYSTVPQNEKVLFSMNIDSLLSPKSVSLMWPSVSRRMLVNHTASTKSHTHTHVYQQHSDSANSAKDVALSSCGEWAYII